MTFDAGDPSGTAAVVPCSAPVRQIQDLVVEGEALWSAERLRDPDGTFGRNWGCVGALFRNSPTEWMDRWCQVFREKKTQPVSPVNDHGILEIPWPVSTDGGTIDLDVLLSIATLTDTRRPTDSDIAAAWSNQTAGYEEYFFQNIRHDLRTETDAAIWKQIEATAPDWMWRKEYVNEITILRSEKSGP